MVYPFSLITTSYEFDGDFMAGQVPLDDTADMADYEAKQVHEARTAGAGR